jgi:quercetin dioxygenase-like cupin family protein
MAPKGTLALALATVCVAVATYHTAFAQHLVDVPQDEPAVRSRLAFSQTLSPLDGRHLEVKVVEVTYGPGGSSTAHRHPCAVIGYVIEGALRMQVKGQPETIYKVGESFYEGPNDVHLVSANASQDARARFLAYFTCDHETPLSVAMPAAKGAGRRQ